MLIGQIMTTDVRACTPDATLAAAARIMSERDCGIVPVVDARGTLCGVLTDRDVCLAVATKCRSPEEIRVDAVMATRLHTCAPNATLRTALKLMKAHAVRRLPVVTATGILVGIVSLDDLALRAECRDDAAVSCEEVVGALKALAASAIAA